MVCNYEEGSTTISYIDWRRGHENHQYLLSESIRNISVNYSTTKSTIHASSENTQKKTTPRKQSSIRGQDGGRNTIAGGKKYKTVISRRSSRCKPTFPVPYLRPSRMKNGAQKGGPEKENVNLKREHEHTAADLMSGLRNFDTQLSFVMDLPAGPQLIALHFEDFSFQSDESEEGLRRYRLFPCLPEDTRLNGQLSLLIYRRPLTSPPPAVLPANLKASNEWILTVLPLLQLALPHTKIVKSLKWKAFNSIPRRAEENAPTPTENWPPQKEGRRRSTNTDIYKYIYICLVSIFLALLTGVSVRLGPSIRRQHIIIEGHAKYLSGESHNLLDRYC